MAANPATLTFKSTKELKVSKKIIDQVIGQDDAVTIVKKAAQQRRHVLLIGEPGTGKSMLGMALAELLPKEQLQDIISFPNPNDENQPLIRTMPAGKGRELVAKAKIQSMASFKNQNVFMLMLVIIAFIAPWFMFSYYGGKYGYTVGAIIFAASLVGAMMFLASFVIFINVGKRMGGEKVLIPKVIVDNFNKEHVPFLDATGAHAGALLGDVLHDPFQCFLPTLKLSYIENNINKSSEICLRIDDAFSRHNRSIIKKEGYEAIFLGNNELFVLGELYGSISPVEVLSCNRHDYDGEMIRLIASGNNELIVTPEHKIAVDCNGKIAYKDAKDIEAGEEIISKPEDIIIDEQDIINTYNEWQQEQCKMYYQYASIKSKNPSWGYKRIAKAMNQPIGKTRWWHAGKHIPVPIQTAMWLKSRGLLPLKPDNPHLPLIAKAIGATFGDGGIFDNLNGIFLSSSELEAVEEFGKDLETIFWDKVRGNSRIIEGGEFGHSWCYQNTNRNLIRFFIALGAPKGNKTKINLDIPNWIYLSENLADEYFGSFFGSEIGIPKVHKQMNRLDMLSIGITGMPKFEENRIEFLNRIKKYLDSKGIEANSLSKNETQTENVFLYRLIISIKFDNVVRFIKNAKISYCRHKKEKLLKTINEFRELKKKKYEELVSRGYGAEHAMKTLQLTPKSLYTILNGEEISP